MVAAFILLRLAIFSADLRQEISHATPLKQRTGFVLYPAKGKRYSLSSRIKNIFLANAVLMARKIRCTGLVHIWLFSVMYLVDVGVSPVFPLFVTLLLRKYPIVQVSS